MAEYINKETACAEVDKGDLLVGNNAEFAKEIINRTPAADVVEVVRCKDCAHYIERKGYDYNGRKARSCIWHGQLRRENDYCSDGIRKEHK